MSGAIRVLVMVDDLQVGGTREVALHQAGSLDPDRFEVGFLTMAGDAESAHARLPAHVRVLSATYRPDYRYRARDYVSDSVLAREARRSGAEVIAAIAGFSPDIVHLHTNPRNLALAKLAHKRTPFVCMLTDHLVRWLPDQYSRAPGLALRFAYRRLYRGIHVVSVGPAVARANASAGFLDPRLEHLTLPNQVDLARFPARPPTSRHGSARIVNVARLHPVKGQAALIRAFSEISSADPVRLTLVGPDSMDGELQRLARQIVAPPLEVEFLGTRDDVPELLAGATVGVLPSLREGMPLALLEMMAASLPVIVSDIPELEALITDGEDGLVVPTGDERRLTQALERLLADPELCDRLGRAARSTAEQAMADPVAELEHFYETALGRDADG
ncbi:MAG: glycosyltransferase [Solirubrobacterales bacterium]|nr:glycosyltransferase [Solirubrobacterales bacterium]